MSEKKKPVLTPGQIIRKRRANYVIGQGYLSLLLRCAALVLVVYVMLTHVFLLTQASGNEMFPAVKDGDVIFAYRLPEKYSKDDVVVYTQNGRTRVGRIVGRERTSLRWMRKESLWSMVHLRVEKSCILPTQKMDTNIPMRFPAAIFTFWVIIAHRVKIPGILAPFPWMHCRVK